MAEEIVITQRRKTSDREAVDIAWEISGYFLYPLSPRLETADNVVITPTPSQLLPQKWTAPPPNGLNLFTAQEKIDLDNGDKVFEKFDLGLTSEQASNTANAVAVLRAHYITLDPRPGFIYQYRFTGRRLDAV
jgi:hypothetical protein